VAVNAKDMIQAVSGRQLAMERQLGELAGTIKALQARVAELSQPAASAPAAGVKAAASATKDAVHREAGEVTPEMLVVITAAVTAFLGKKVRIRSAKMLQSPYEVVNPWSQQGRVFVQASHILRSRG
jgi:methylmalonyl-CoA carboxyltransferase large subunit